MNGPPGYGYESITRSFVTVDKACVTAMETPWVAGTLVTNVRSNKLPASTSNPAAWTDRLVRERRRRILEDGVQARIQFDSGAQGDVRRNGDRDAPGPLVARNADVIRVDRQGAHVRVERLVGNGRGERLELHDEEARDIRAEEFPLRLDRVRDADRPLGMGLERKRARTEGAVRRKVRIRDESEAQDLRVGGSILPVQVVEELAVRRRQRVRVEVEPASVAHRRIHEARGEGVVLVESAFRQAPAEIPRKPGDRDVDQHLDGGGVAPVIVVDSARVRTRCGARGNGRRDVHGRRAGRGNDHAGTVETQHRPWNALVELDVQRLWERSTGARP